MLMVVEERHRVIRQCGGDRWNALWRLCVFLRCGRDGADAKWIPLRPPQRNPRGVTHWYRDNLQKLAMQRRMDDPSNRAGQRNSRISRWIQQGEELRKQFQVELTEPDLLEFLGFHEPKPSNTFQYQYQQ